MNNLEKINELSFKLQGKPNTAKERIYKLLDSNSFVEMGSFNTGANVITGYGTIDRRLVYVFSQSGAVNVRHANKVAQLYEYALKMGAPIIGIMDSEGMKIQDGVDSLEAYGILFSNQSFASGVVPQISVILGDCLGISTFNPVLSDFVFMTNKNSRFFMSSPSTFEGIEGKTTNYDDIGGGENHAEKTGFVDFNYDDEDECLKQVKRLISFLPSNNLEEHSINQTSDDLNREDDFLNTIVSDDINSSIDINSIILSVADNNDFFEVKKNYAKNIITGFIRLNSFTVGVIANNGLLNIEAAQKAGNFVTLCDAFNIPIVSFTDISGYESSYYEEYHGIMRYGAKLLNSFVTATVPKINVIIRNGIGSSYLIMNSKHIGADVVYAWPSSNISVLNKDGLIKVMHISEEKYEDISNPYNIAQKGYIDSIIIPSTTRKRLLIALEMLATKREMKPVRKHSSVEY